MVVGDGFVDVVVANVIKTGPDRTKQSNRSDREAEPSPVWVAFGRNL